MSPNLQALNGYSYVLNNPLSLTDPSGHFFSGIFRAIGSALRAVVRAVGRAIRAVLRSALGRSILQIAICANPLTTYACIPASGALTLAAGGSVVDAVKAAAFAFASQAVWFQVGDILKPALQTADFGGGLLIKSATHGVVGGALSMAQGGSFMDGFAANAVGAGAGFITGESPLGSVSDGDVVIDTFIVAAAGGAASELSGGKFANGAITAAFANLYNKFGARTIGDIIEEAAAFRNPLNDPCGILGPPLKLACGGGGAIL